MSLYIKVVIVNDETHEPLINTSFTDADDLVKFAQAFAANQAERKGEKGNE